MTQPRNLKGQFTLDLNPDCPGSVTWPDDPILNAKMVCEHCQRKFWLMPSGWFPKHKKWGPRG